LEIVFDPFGSSAGHKPAVALGQGIAFAQDADAGSDLLAAPMKKAVQDLKLRMLKSALERSRYNQRKAAAILGLTYDQFRGLYRRLQRGGWR
jgi:psp operon transcriptional activator